MEVVTAEWQPVDRDAELLHLGETACVLMAFDNSWRKAVRVEIHPDRSKGFRVADAAASHELRYGLTSQHEPIVSQSDTSACVVVPIVIPPDPPSVAER